ncbi:type VII secretion-associated serine protease mycosin [Streptomyces meridianus]|uniref:Type VII secretion-associated serine protease mycosin n=1 Tax=Streptomyces meridianus TaxID=2938945 RepID=A0ABT0XBD8_9ACTN|nr:type VII secretion-associated serine protease mycosin [Streptomyces meridianus]MCM2579841.1 type VII secretion-associated serine protease mycosin [Streptomyces meridianus]
MSVTRTLRAVGSAVLAGALLIGTGSVASADEIRDSQWPLKAFDAEKVWRLSTGRGVTVAVIDNGVNRDHPDLRGNVLPGKDFTGAGTADRVENSDHGTGMASLIAGHGHGPGGSQGIKGLAPDVKILPLQVSDGEEDSAGDGELAKAIRYAVDHGATVINMSIAGHNSRDEEKRAIAYALKRDVLVVAGAGNSGTNNKQYPAAYPGVLAVGAVDSTGTIWENSTYGPHLKLTAPGVHINSAGTEVQYGFADGTSDSTAYVSAAAALLRAKFPDLTAGQVANRLTKTALKPDGVSQFPDEHYGYGTIRPLRALTEDVPAGSKYGPLEVPKSDPSAGAPGSSSGDNASDENGGISPVAIVLVLGVLALLVVVIALVVKGKNRRNGPPSGGSGGWGHQGGVPGYPQHHPNPHQQQEPPPGSYPSAPPPRQ